MKTIKIVIAESGAEHFVTMRDRLAPSIIASFGINQDVAVQRQAHRLVIVIEFIARAARNSEARLRAQLG